VSENRLKLENNAQIFVSCIPTELVDLNAKVANVTTTAADVQWVGLPGDYIVSGVANPKRFWGVGAKFVILDEQQYFVLWDTASQSTK